LILRSGWHTVRGMRFSPFGFLMVTLAAASAAFAQAPAPPAPAPAAAQNMVRNGDFKASFATENLWAGVDSKGNLAGFKAAVPVLAESGAIAATILPVSVAVADMNGDSLPDIVSADSQGYVRVYFNSGTAQAPKFARGELAGIFLGYPGRELPSNARLAPHVAVAPLSGKPDLIVGNYAGELLYIQNQGTGVQPVFKQPADFARTIIPTSKDLTRRWGNVFAPVVWDWNGDAKPDLLVGEGSYSANNIHLLLNEGTAAAPRSSEGGRHVIAFGDGREQLTPAVVDYNGDGLPDLLIASRDGQIAVHLHPPGAWKPGTELKFTSFVPIGGDASRPIKLNGLSTVGVGDLNGDGMFDIVTGGKTGQIFLIVNEGTKQEPKFSEPVPIKGGAPTPAFRSATGWDVDYGLRRGNMLGYVSVVSATEDPNAAPPEGATCLKAGYIASPNTIMPPPQMVIPGVGNYDPKQERYFLSAAELLEPAPSNYFMIRQAGRVLNNNSRYTLSFRVKGARVSNAQAALIFHGVKQLGEEKIVRGDRGRTTVTENEVHETIKETVAMSPGATWTAVSKTIPVQFKEKELRDLKKTGTSAIEFVFALAPEGGEFYIDDVKLVEAK